ncbi:hypothetical protein V6N11_000290 [Hibiscus sabdariffa]|uniref:Uncharacterized protein n=1 Tax=Hibiscus sabdariffa TaxID=183260 RepID=A0ABR2NFN6_9ROSI
MAGDPMIPTPTVYGDYFKFDNCLSSEPTCRERVLECWNVYARPTLDKLAHVGSSLDSWQQDRIRKSTGCIKQLQGTINEMMDRPLTNDALENLSKAEAELKALVDKDEAYWFQRSKVHWLWEDGTMVQQTGSLTQVPLPWNFSGMNVSTIRLGSRSLWEKGTNSSFIEIPPRVITMPHVKRLALVYHDLGKWSSKYYQVPGYSLISPIIGFNVYDSSNLTTLSDRNVTLSTMGEPISIYLPNVDAEDKNVTELKYVKFRKGGPVEISNMTKKNVCLVRATGRFSVVASKKKKKGGI